MDTQSHKNNNSEAQESSVAGISRSGEKTISSDDADSDINREMNVAVLTPEETNIVVMYSLC
jgi:hypothetical protein